MLNMDTADACLHIYTYIADSFQTNSPGTCCRQYDGSLLLKWSNIFINLLYKSIPTQTYLLCEAS